MGTDRDVRTVEQSVSHCGECPNEYDGWCTHPITKLAIANGHADRSDCAVDEHDGPGNQPPIWCPLRAGAQLVTLRLA